MIKALLIADGKNVSDVDHLTFSELQQLVQKYPVIVARQFTIVLNARMTYFKHYSDCLGSKIADFWIDFHNSETCVNSSHLHV